MPPQLISRSEAIAKGDVHYFTGKPCKRGHIGLRYTATRNCVKCNQTPEYKVAQKVRVKLSTIKKQLEYSARQRKWWAGNRSKACTYSKEYRARNPEKVATYSKEWNAKNRDSRTAYAIAQHAKRKCRIAVDFGELDRFVVLEAKRKCARLKKRTGYAWQIDHILPLNKGGLHKFDNLQVLPAVLNRFKSDKLIYLQVGEWLADWTKEPHNDDPSQIYRASI